MQESQILDSSGVRTQTGHTAFQKKTLVVLLHLLWINNWILSVLARKQEKTRHLFMCVRLILRAWARFPP